VSHFGQPSFPPSFVNPLIASSIPATFLFPSSSHHPLLSLLLSLYSRQQSRVKGGKLLTRFYTFAAAFPSTIRSAAFNALPIDA